MVKEQERRKLRGKRVAAGEDACFLGSECVGLKQGDADPYSYFNGYSLLGALLLAFDEYGVPCRIRLDNHPVHHAKWIRRVLRQLGVRLHFTQPASPWQNGRIERFFGTLKSCLQGYVIRHAGHLAQSLKEFRFWYNEARCHQYLHGLTPMQAWQGVDPYRQAPKHVQWFQAWEGRLRGMVLRH